MIEQRIPHTGSRPKQICHECVGESYLAAEIQSSGSLVQCSYCTEITESWPLNQLADRVELAFEHHFIRTADQPDGWQQSLMSDRESSYEWERDGEPVIDAIASAAVISHDVAADVQAILNARHWDKDAAILGEETAFCSGSYYEQTSGSSGAWHKAWQSFDQSIRTEARFFSRMAANHLADVFGSIDRLKTTKNRKLVVQAGPRHSLKHLFRARVFQSTGRLEAAIGRPDRHLGPPPSELASAGRMNAAGISVFYGATIAKTAIAEVRPPVGSKVVVAKFCITRPLTLLDLTALENVVDDGSIFDQGYKTRLERASFLRSLGSLMTRPVMPDDQALDYLSTQAVADFLATENDPVFDGIIFQSVQRSVGRNVVLFRKAALVEELVLPAGTEISSQSYSDTEDGPEIDYAVYEEVPENSNVQQPGVTSDHFSRWLEFHQDDAWALRQPTLRVIPESVAVYALDGVQYMTTRHAVRRHRWERRKADF